MHSFTYDEWKAKGFQVQKGQKATGRNTAGKCTFSGDQVQLRKSRFNYNPNEEDDFDQDDYDLWYDMYGHTRDWV